MEPVKLHYFKGRGRAETTRWMLAVNEIPFINVPVNTALALAELRAANILPFDQLPLLEIDELKLSQSSAMIRYLARKGDFYGSSNEDAMWCDLIAAVADDFSETAKQAAFQPSTVAATTALQARFDKFGPRLESRIQSLGTGFTATDRLSFADVVLAEALTDYQAWIPELLDDAPGLDNLHKQVIAHPGIAAYLQSPQRYPIADDDYVVDIARVLERALPGHMPNANRFVASVM